MKVNQLLFIPYTHHDSVGALLAPPFAQRLGGFPQEWDTWAFTSIEGR